MSVKMSLAMRQELREVVTKGFVIKSNTNSTLHALEKRGYLKIVPDADASKRLCFRWEPTEAGKAFF